MKMRPIRSVLFAGLLFFGTAAFAVAQTGTEDHDVHHPGEPEATAQPAVPGDAPAAGMPGEVRGMTGMMTPEMMQMMQRMMAQGGMPGMMGQDQMPEAMMMCPMMQMMMGARSAMLYGMPHGPQGEMTQERVRALLEQRLAQHGNPRLKLGNIATAADGSITAEIVTVDGSLVQKLAFNRYPGLARQITE